MTYREHRRSSFLTRAKESFYRSKGTRGASVELLRGDTGSNFESQATVKRHNKGNGLFSCFTGQKGSKRYIVIKGPHIFVFANENSSSPQYAIPLSNESVETYDKKGNKQVVTLLNGLAEVEYEFEFDLREKSDLGATFSRVLKEQIIVGHNDEIKAKLGHTKTSQNSKSFCYAKNIGKEKEQDQPAVSAASNDVLGAYDHLQP